jgi:hypothetical protein
MRLPRRRTLLAILGLIAVIKGGLSLMFALSAGMILWVSGTHGISYLRTRHLRFLITSVSTIPAALFLISLTIQLWSRS